METNNLILIEQVCTNHKIEFSFINSLHQFGLIEIIVIEENSYLNSEQLAEVEKMIRLHYELDINLEGIDVIANLLKQIDHLQLELIATKNQLRRHEIG